MSYMTKKDHDILRVQCSKELALNHSGFKDGTLYNIHKHVMSNMGIIDVIGNLYIFH